MTGTPSQNPIGSADIGSPPGRPAGPEPGVSSGAGKDGAGNSPGSAATGPRPVEPDAGTPGTEGDEEITVLSEDDLDDLITEAEGTPPAEDPQPLPPPGEVNAETPLAAARPYPGSRPPAEKDRTDISRAPAHSDLRPLVPAGVEALVPENTEKPAPRDNTQPLQWSAPGRHGWTRTRITGVAASVLALLGIGAALLFHNGTIPGWTAAGRALSPAYPVPVRPPTAARAPGPGKVFQTGQAPGPSDAWLPELSGPVAEAAELRRKLLTQHAEIVRLQEHYRAGLDTVAGGLRRRVSPSPEVSYAVVSKDRQAVWDLTTISRRGAYIDQLETIAAQLDAASAHLLHLERRAAVYSLIHPVARGMDPSGLAQVIQAATETHAGTLANLTFQADPADLPPPARVWAAMVDEAAGTREKNPDSAGPRPEGKSETEAHARQDLALFAEICGGDFSRKHLLTALSEEAAGCLSRWPGKDLILSGLADLSAEAAERLTRWQGDWLCLNGPTRISEAAARHLFRWNGNHLSLNGVAALTPDISRYIPDWQGRQLELTGLADLSYAVAADLVRWQKKGGRLFVPRQFMADTP